MIIIFLLYIIPAIISFFIMNKTHYPDYGIFDGILCITPVLNLIWLGWLIYELIVYYR